MSHHQQLNYIKEVKDQFRSSFLNSRVLEIGSLDINGSIRQFFENCEYIGLDVGPGPGVDIVCEGQLFNDPDNSFDVTISCECFEHNPFWLETFKNMVRLCKPGGLVVFTCATTGRKEHGTSRTTPLDSPLTVKKGWDYYRNLEESDFTSELNLKSLFKDFKFSSSLSSKDLYFWGIKHD